MPVCVELDEATDLLLCRGFNDFSGYTDFVFTGTMDTTCSYDDNCALQWQADYNMWGMAPEDGSGISNDGLLSPLSSMFDVTAAASEACAGYEMDNACPIQFSDVSPFKVKECPGAFDGDRTMESVRPRIEESPWKLRSAMNSIFITGNFCTSNCIVFDASGRRIHSESFTANTSSEFKLNVQLSSGVYMVFIQSETGSECCKVVVP